MTDVFGFSDVLLIKTDIYGNAEIGDNKEFNCKNIFRVMPNPFITFARIFDCENDYFNLSDITGRMVGKYKGAKIGENLPAGVYFLISQDKNINPFRIVKIK